MDAGSNFFYGVNTGRYMEIACAHPAHLFHNGREIKVIPEQMVYTHISQHGRHFFLEAALGAKKQIEDSAQMPQIAVDTAAQKEITELKAALKFANDALSAAQKDAQECANAAAAQLKESTENDARHKFITHNMIAQWVGNHPPKTIFFGDYYVEFMNSNVDTIPYDYFKAGVRLAGHIIAVTESYKTLVIQKEAWLKGAAF